LKRERKRMRGYQANREGDVISRMREFLTGEGRNTTEKERGSPLPKKAVQSPRASKEE